VDPTRKLAMRRVVLAGDAVIIAGSMIAAFVLQGLLRDVVPFLKVPPRFSQYALLAYLAVPLWLLLAVAFELDRAFEKPRPSGEIVIDVLRMHLVGAIGLAVLVVLTQAVVNRSLVALFLGCSFSLMTFERLLINRWIEYQHRTGHGRERILLVGEPSRVMREFVQRAREEIGPPEIVGYLAGSRADPGSPAEVSGDLPPRRGLLSDLDHVLHEEEIHQVFFLAPFDQPAAASDSLKVCDTVGVPASFPIRLEQPFEARPVVRTLFGLPFVTFDRSPKPALALAAKRAIDFTLAALLAIALAPLLVSAGLAILATMGRPVLFAQERAGLYGRRFRMLKFRTMEREAEERRDALLAQNEMSGPVFKVTDDPRVTRLGRWLRKFSIDELPQLANVLFGSMSLVGPRPLPIREQQEIRGWHRRRLSMKPGITGLWQVSGRSLVDFEEWMKLDLRYVDEWSLRLDAWILLKTIPAVLLGKGSR
jgi:exopolysaccharide biosynthesis polyprenyl glycosylphosphotransferase